MRSRIAAILGLLFLMLAPAALADTVALFDWGLNVNGTVYTSGSGPDPATVPGADLAAFDPATGLGSITLTYRPGVAGAYFVLSFFDHEIDEEVNTFFNEFGTAVGAGSPGQSWEIDDPLPPGDIYENFAGAHLDHFAIAGAQDISMALGWDFILSADEYAVITFRLSPAAPASGFYLHQWDPDSQTSAGLPGSPDDVYLSSDIMITSTGVPEPGTVALFAIGLLGLLCQARKRVRS